MCGIVGFWSPTLSADAHEAVLRRMSSCLAHRGPDSDGLWTEPGVGLALGHRRLAIVDLSASGAQPMFSHSGRWVVVLNGEIYNFRTLRDELHALGHTFHGTSDTEVFLAAVESWGVRRAVERCAGMFAIALWDRAERRLYLIRDRLGEKPLYVGAVGGSLLFASELKSLRQHPHWEGRVDPAALAGYVRFAYVPAPHSIYDGIQKLTPGTIARYDLSGHGSLTPEVEVYWSAASVMESGAANRLQGTDEEMVDQLDAVLKRTVSEEMVSDVQLGAFLSGGVDSSLVVALMQAMSSTPVRTFSIGMEEDAYNEADHAKAVAAHLGTDHTERYVSATDAMNIIVDLPRIYDEPFADSSQIPTYLVSRIARGSVTVALSGDGGDEVFGGYNRYAWMERIWARVGAAPLMARQAAAATLRAVPPGAWDAAGTAAGRLMPGLRMRNYGDKAHKLAQLLALPSKEAFYREVVSSWSSPAAVLRNAAGTEAGGDAFGTWSPQLTFTEQMMLADMLTYLPDDILVKVDRAAMAVSLETRAPFIDHRVVEFAARLPYRCKVRGPVAKWILKELLYRYVPRALIERPKMGFGVPLHSWLRGGLRDWAESLLAPERLTREGYFNVGAVRTVWDDHLSGRTNNMARLWPILMFEAWLDEQGPVRKAAQ